MSRRLHLCPIALLAAALASPLPAVDSILLARAPGLSSPAVIAGPAGLEVRSGDASAELDLPPRARVEGIVGLGSGWLLSATRPDVEGRELLLIADAGDGPEEIPPPAHRRASRAEPVPVVAEGELAGLLWLEGDEETEHGVRWASWNGAGFDSPVEVAPPGPGSQLALRAVTLADGRVLAAWAGFDGVDDEIRASLLDRGEWSEPVRVGEDNRVPDILPTLTADSRGGAWIAWCRYDGSEYRVATARFDGRSFGPAGPAGPPGSLYPSFERLGSDSVLLWFDAGRDAWVLAELVDGERLVERASTPGSSELRPAVVRSEAGVVFRFGDEQRPADWQK